MTHVVATFDQRAYRYRNDDGTETSATWKAAENTTITQLKGEVFRIRIAVQETAGGSANNQTIVLQSNVNGVGWQTVDVASNNVRLASSAHVNDQTPTTRQLTGTSGSFVTGLLLTETSGTDISFNGNDHTEVEWASLLIDNDVPHNATVQFRVTINGAVVNTITASPSLTAIDPPQESFGASTVDVNVTTEGQFTTNPQMESGASTVDVDVTPEGMGFKTEVYITYSLGSEVLTRTIEVAGTDFSGASTVDVNVSTEGQGIAEQVQHEVGSSSATVNVSVEGQGTAQIVQEESGASTVDVNVSTEGQGTAEAIQSEVGSSTVDVNVTTEGQGQAALEAAGASTVLVDVSTEGQGQGALAVTGSSTVAVDVTTDGAGTGEISSEGSSTVDINVTTEGFGSSNQEQSVVGSSTVVIDVTTEGQGSGEVHAVGSSTVTINVIPEGFGSDDQQQSELGSSTVTIDITSEGLGFGSIDSSGASTSTIDVTTEGQGQGSIDVISSSTVTVDVITDGLGSGAITSSGASTVPVAITTEGEGTATLDIEGASTATVNVTALASGVAGIIELRNITVEFSPIVKSDIEFNAALVSTSISEPITVIEIDSATLISPVEIDIPITDPFGYAEARVLKNVLESELDTHIGEPTGV